MAWAGAGVGRGIAGASQSGIGAAPGTGAGVASGNGQNFGGVAHNYGGTFTGLPARSQDFSQPVRTVVPTLAPPPEVPTPQRKPDVGLSSKIGALVAMGIDPGLAAALVGAPIGANYGGVQPGSAPGTAVQGTKGDFGGPTIGGPPGTAAGGQDHFGGRTVGGAPGTASGGQADFAGLRGSTHGMNSSTNPVGVRGVGPKGDFGSGFPGRRGDFGSAPSGLQGGYVASPAEMAAAAAAGPNPNSPFGATMGPQGPSASPRSYANPDFMGMPRAEVEAAIDAAFNGWAAAEPMFAGMNSRADFAESRRGSGLGVGRSSQAQNRLTQLAEQGRPVQNALTRDAPRQSDPLARPRHSGGMPLPQRMVPQPTPYSVTQRGR